MARSCHSTHLPTLFQNLQRPNICWRFFFSRSFYGQAPLPRGSGDATKSSSCRVCTTTVDGRVANDMGAVDRELALLEQSNAALFAALAQTRAMPVSRLPPALDGKTSLGGRGAERAERSEVIKAMRTMRERGGGALLPDLFAYLQQGLGGRVSWHPPACIALSACLTLPPPPRIIYL